MKILIVDDEPKIVRLLGGHFEIKGHKVVGAGEGQEAITLAQQHQPALALVDLKLKGKLSGLDVLNELKRLLPQIRVVIVSGDQDTPTDAVLQQGAVAFLRKPVQLEELDQLLQDGNPPAAS